LNNAGDLSGKVVVTCSLPMNAGNTKLVVTRDSSGAEELARMIPKAQAVCASNPVPSEVLFGVFDALVAAKPPVEGLPPQTFTRAPSSPT
jgi:8-hydroxy-5-deazaflavin:NADPH oxidoreductase